MFRSKKFIVAVAVIAVALGFLLFNSLQSGSVYYYTVSEFKAQQTALDGKSVRVVGIVTSGSVVTDSAARTLRFTIGDGTQTLPVAYNRGVVPDAFGPDVEVVVEGVYKSGAFQADNILAKCPSKYEPKTS